MVAEHHPRSVWILGGGYLGAALHEYWLREGVESRRFDMVADRADVVADVTNGDVLAAKAAELGEPDTVFLCMSTSGGDCDDYRRLYVRAVEVVNGLFPGARRILCSSTSLYGILDGSWATEAHACEPLHGQGRVLLEAERLLRQSGGIVARLAPLYGPGRSVLLRKFLDGSGCVHGAGDRWLNYVHRDDAVAALALLAVSDCRHQCYNVADAVPMVKADVYGYLSELTGLDIPEDDGCSSRRGGTNQRVSSALLMALGWQPLYPSFADGVPGVLESFGFEV